MAKTKTLNLKDHPVISQNIIDKTNIEYQIKLPVDEIDETLWFHPGILKMVEHQRLTHYRSFTSTVLGRYDMEISLHVIDEDDKTYLVIKYKAPEDHSEVNEPIAYRDGYNAIMELPEYLVKILSNLIQLSVGYRKLNKTI